MKAISEYPDLLSPFLVKELRQGLRGHVFVGLMLWIQVSMCFLSLLTITGSQLLPLVSTLYWFNVVVLLHIVLPLRQVITGDEDLAWGNYDLLRVTPAPADKIMISKWLSVMAQMSLCAMTFLPYQLVRYFVGGTEIAMELTLLAVMLINGSIFALWGMTTSTCSRGWRLLWTLVMILIVTASDTATLSMTADWFAKGAPRVAESMVMQGVIYMFTGMVSLGITSTRYDFDLHQQTSYIA